MTISMNRDFWNDFVAGWIGGCAGLLAGHPLDTVKVRQQTLGKTSALRGFINTFKYEGVKGFYKGMSFPLLSTGTLNSLFFGVYANTLRYLSKDKARASYSDVFWAACAGGTAQLSVACPIDVVKIKMQLQTEGGSDVWGGKNSVPKTHYSRSTSCLIDLYRSAGIRGCYKGLGSMAVRDVPSFGLYMMTYEVFMRNISGHENQANPASLIFCGGMAGALSWMVIVPLDVIKSRIQADDVKNPKYKNMYDCCVKSYRQEGLSVFTRGFSLVVLRAFPTNGAIFLAYVSTLNFLRQVQCSQDLNNT